MYHLDDRQVVLLLFATISLYEFSFLLQIYVQ
jgi:hypothetical protein